MLSGYQNHTKAFGNDDEECAYYASGKVIGTPWQQRIADFICDPDKTFVRKKKEVTFAQVEFDVEEK